MMAARGTKRTCDNDECGRRFYDLNKMPTDCPYCGEAFTAQAATVIDLHAPIKRRQGRNYTLEGPVAAPVADPLPADDAEAIVDADSDDEKATTEELELVLEVDDDSDAAADDVLGGDIAKDDAS